jgi:hypothetical protein
MAIIRKIIEKNLIFLSYLRKTVERGTDFGKKGQHLFKSKK